MVTNRLMLPSLYTIRVSASCVLLLRGHALFPVLVGDVLNHRGFPIRIVLDHGTDWTNDAGYRKLDEDSGVGQWVVPVSADRIAVAHVQVAQRPGRVQYHRH